MVKRDLKLTITEAAYFAVLDRVSQSNLNDSLPLLSYNKNVNRYAISAYKSIVMKEVKNVSSEKIYPLMYQVGRLNMYIKSPELAAQLYEKKLDYYNGEFIVV